MGVIHLGNACSNCFLEKSHTIVPGLPVVQCSTLPGKIIITQQERECGTVQKNCCV